MADQNQESENEKTEQPSQRKKEKFREEGQFAISKELGNLVILAAVHLLAINASSFIDRAKGVFLSAFSNLDITQAIDAVKWTLVRVMIIIASIAVPLYLIYGAQTRFAFVTKKLRWNFGKLNILKGIFSMFSFRLLTEFLKTCAKLFFLFAAVYFAAREEISGLFYVSDVSIKSFFTKLIKIIAIVLRYVTLYFIIIAGFDYGFILFKHLKKLKMDKQEQKQEYKEQEGDPSIKGRRKKIQRENLQRLLAQQVPKSEFVVTNPEHYAVAIEWQDKNKNPKIAAKGMDLIAQQIKNIAYQHNIPVVRSPLLARKLYAELEVGAYINKEHFKAIGKIIIYIKKKKLAHKPVRGDTM